MLQVLSTFTFISAQSYRTNKINRFVWNGTKTNNKGNFWLYHELQEVIFHGAQAHFEEERNKFPQNCNSQNAGWEEQLSEKDI